MDDTRPPRHSSRLDDKSDRGAPFAIGLVNPRRLLVLPNGDVLGRVLINAQIGGPLSVVNWQTFAHLRFTAFDPYRTSPDTASFRNHTAISDEPPMGCGSSLRG